ncbi:MAG: alpha/beta hydrolase [Rubrivivax sp.]|jgi:haloacetate dehalogenase|nr:alpha/beta hydrolase [Rubrivivax sp.]
MLRLPGFAEHFVVSDGLSIRAQIGGEGPPLLLLHGHPQTQAMWHRVASALARDFTVVACDLRGYGDSSKPAGSPGHANYSKRAMALDPVAVMRHFGFERFRVMAHDRGARVAHRLAMDHAERVERLVLLDIAPTLAMYEQTTMTFASAYFHWFFLIQPAPLPERMISADSDFYLTSLMGGRHAGLGAFAPEALAEYLRCARDPATVHGMCEDYRAAASIDLDHDRADRDAGLKLACPLLVLWGEHGTIQRCFDPVAEWRRVALNVRGHALPCGHYIAEEAPEALLNAALPFLRT